MPPAICHGSLASHDKVENNQHSYVTGGKINHQVFHTESLFIHRSHEVNVEKILAGYFRKEQALNLWGLT